MKIYSGIAEGFRMGWYSTKREVRDEAKRENLILDSIRIRTVSAQDNEANILRLLNEEPLIVSAEDQIERKVEP